MLFYSQLRAERKANQKLESRQKVLIEELWKAIGIDPDTTPDYLTLGEIGLESMFAVKLQQQLEREFNEKISLNHIKYITIKMLKDYGEGKMETSHAYLDELKRVRNELIKMKFIIPNETHTRLNGLRSGKPIYFFPPAETTFSNYEEYSKRFDRPVIGLNWTRDMNKFETIKELTQYYSDLMNKIEPNAKHDLVGGLDGAYIIAKLLRKGRVNKSVIFDFLVDKELRDHRQSDNELLTEIYTFMFGILPVYVQDKISRETDPKSDLTTKISKFINEVKDIAGSGFIAPDIEEIFYLVFKRTQMTLDHRVKVKDIFTLKLKELIGKRLVIIKGFRIGKTEDIQEKIEMARNAYMNPDAEVFIMLKLRSR